MASWAWVILLLLAVVFIAAVPTWPYSAAWGYWPSGILGLLFLIVVVWMLAGPWWSGRGTY